MRDRAQSKRSNGNFALCTTHTHTHCISQTLSLFATKFLKLLSRAVTDWRVRIRPTEGAHNLRTNLLWVTHTLLFSHSWHRLAQVGIGWHWLALVGTGWHWLTQVGNSMTQVGNSMTQVGNSMTQVGNSMTNSEVMNVVNYACLILHGV